MTQYSYDIDLIWKTPLPLLKPNSTNTVTSIKKTDPVTGPVWPRGWVEVWLYSSVTAALEGGEWSAARPGRTLPPGKTR